MRIKRFILGSYETNCYLISYKNEAIIIDPGYESQDLIDTLMSDNLALKYISVSYTHLLCFQLFHLLAC